MLPVFSASMAGRRAKYWRSSNLARTPPVYTEKRGEERGTAPDTTQYFGAANPNPIISQSKQAQYEEEKATRTLTVRRHARQQEGFKQGTFCEMLQIQVEPRAPHIEYNDANSNINSIDAADQTPLTVKLNKL